VSSPDSGAALESSTAQVGVEDPTPDPHRPEATTPEPHLIGDNLVLALVRRLYREAAKFGAVGLVCAAIDLGVFNLLSYTGAPLHRHPLTARAISVVVATVVSYIGNRWWTWRDRERAGLAREYALFFAINLVGLGINLGVLAFAEYVLGFHSGITRNIANLIGIAIGTLVRFVAYRRWVFLESTGAQSSPASSTASATRRPDGALGVEPPRS